MNNYINLYISFEESGIIYLPSWQIYKLFHFSIQITSFVTLQNVIFTQTVESELSTEDTELSTIGNYLSTITSDLSTMTTDISPMTDGFDAPQNFEEAIKATKTLDLI